MSSCPARRREALGAAFTAITLAARGGSAGASTAARPAGMPGQRPPQR